MTFPTVHALKRMTKEELLTDGRIRELLLTVFDKFDNVFSEIYHLSDSNRLRVVKEYIYSYYDWDYQPNRVIIPSNLIEGSISRLHVSRDREISWTSRLVMINSVPVPFYRPIRSYLHIIRNAETKYTVGDNLKFICGVVLKQIRGSDVEPQLKLLLRFIKYGLPTIVGIEEYQRPAVVIYAEVYYDILRKYVPSLDISNHMRRLSNLPVSRLLHTKHECMRQDFLVPSWAHLQNIASVDASISRLLLVTFEAPVDNT